MQLFLVLALIISIVAVVFALQNLTPITVNLLAWQFQGSLALVLLIALAVGVLTSVLVSMPAVIRRNRSTSTHAKRILELENQLADRDKKIRELEAKLQEQPLKGFQAPVTSLPEPIKPPPELPS